MTQVEMTNPLARQQLREMLEFQMNEKEQIMLKNDPNQNRARMRFMRGNMGSRHGIEGSGYHQNGLEPRPPRPLRPQ